MAMTYDPVFAVDPNNPANVARNATITIFDPADANQAPITITDPTGVPLPNPMTLDAAGMGPAYQHPTLARVGWKGAGFVGYFTSYEGMFNETVAAKEAAQAAVGDASAAAAERVTNATVTGGKLILTKATGATVDAGSVLGPKGDKGDKGDKGIDGANVLPTQQAIEQAITADGPAKSALNGAYARAKKPGTFVALGDSTTGVDYNSGVLWPQALQAISGRKLSLLKNAGVGGDTTAMMLARVQADVVALNPSLCVYLGGTNDVLNGVPFATTQANIIAAADAINAAGIEFVIGTILPRNAHTGTSGVSAVRTLNGWIKLWAASRGYRVIDFNKTLANPRSGEYAAGTNYDTVHANATGNILMAQAAAAVLTAAGQVAYVPSVAPHEGEVDYLSSIDSGTVPRSAQIFINPLLWDLNNDTWPERIESKAVARVVTASSAGATSIDINAPITPGAYRFGTGAAQQETLTVTSVTGSASPYTANLSSAAVNPHPVSQKVDTAALTAETVSTDTRFSGSRALKIVGTAQTGAQDVLTYRLPAAWAVGDKLRLVHKLALDTPTSIPASTSGTGYGVEVKLVFNGTSTVAKSVTRWAYATPAGLALEFAVDATVPTGTTSVDVVATVNLGGGNATIFLSEVGVWNLSTLGIASVVLPV